MGATIKDVAKKAGLSLGTVSKYLNHKPVSEKNQVLIQQAIDELGYRVNGFARSLRTSTSKMIGILVPDLENSFSVAVSMRIESLLAQSGYGVLVCTYRNSSVLESEKLRWLAEKQVDGIIFMPSEKMQKNGFQELKTIMGREFPIILFDSIIDSFPCDSVLVDNINASYTAVEKFACANHKKIAIILADQDTTSQKERLEGYKRALSDYRIPFNSDYVKCSGYGQQGGYACGCAILQNNPEVTAIFSTGYRMSLGVLRAIRESNRTVGKDISFIGFDCQDLSAIFSPTLTTLDQPIDQISSSIVNLLLERIDGQSGSLPKLLRLKVKCTDGDSVCVID